MQDALVRSCADRGNMCGLTAIGHCACINHPKDKHEGH